MNNHNKKNYMTLTQLRQLGICDMIKEKEYTFFSLKKELHDTAVTSREYRTLVANFVHLCKNKVIESNEDDILYIADKDYYSELEELLLNCC